MSRLKFLVENAISVLHFYYFCPIKKLVKRYNFNRNKWI